MDGPAHTKFRNQWRFEKGNNCIAMQYCKRAAIESYGSI